MRPEEVLHNDISLMRYPVACRAKLPRRGYTCWKGDLTSVVLTTRSRKIEYHFPPLELRSQNGQDRDLTSLWTRASRSSGLRFRKRRDPPAALPQQPLPFSSSVSAKPLMRHRGRACWRSGRVRFSAALSCCGVRPTIQRLCWRPVREKRALFALSAVTAVCSRAA